MRKYFPGLVSQEVARPGELNLPAVAGNSLTFSSPSSFSYGPAERWLCDKELFSCPAKMKLIGQGHKIFQSYADSLIPI